MRMSRFDASIRQYYQGKVLADDKVEVILARTGTRKRLGVRYYQVLAAAAILLVAFVGLQRHLDSAALKERVLGEIAMNHRKQLDVEFAADHYLELQNKLDRLDFPIAPGRSAFARNYRLVGGRYCSIQGQLAAQLKVEDKISGELLTFYVVPLSVELQGFSDSEQTFGDVHIRLWQEDDRFFALAGAAPEGR